MDDDDLVRTAEQIVASHRGSRDGGTRRRLAVAIEVTVGHQRATGSLRVRLTGGRPTTAADGDDERRRRPKRSHAATATYAPYAATSSVDGCARYPRSPAANPPSEPCS